MPSPFAAAEARSSAAVSRWFGQRLRLVPWKAAGDYSHDATGEADPGREPVEFRGTLSGALGSQNLQGDRTGSGNMRASMTTRDRTVTVDFTETPAGMRKGDLIQSIDENGGVLATHEITSIIPDGMNRNIVNMVLK